MDGVRACKATGLALMTRENEVAVTVNKGKVAPAALVQALAKAGYPAEPEPLDTWSLTLTFVGKAGSPPPLDGMRKTLAQLEGVTEVSCKGPLEIQVSGYAPHVSTAQLLKAASDPGVWEAGVRTEQVSLKVKGADCEEKLSQARAKLALVMGVVEAKAEKGQIQLTREKGRAALGRLNKALQGTGCSVELAG